MIERLPRSSLLALSLASIAGVSTAQVTHREHYLGWANGAVTNTALDGRLSQAAMQYRSYAPVPRIAFYDIAFPKDCAEFATMSGHAVLVVTAVVQDSADLPPARIYLGSGPAGTDLLRIGGVQSRVASADVRAPLGQFRVDRSEEHTSELQSQSNLVCRLLLEKKIYEFYTRNALTARNLF